MGTEFVWQLLRRVVAQLTLQIGFSSATQPALEILTDLLDERLSSICIDTKRFAELDQRTDPNLRDLSAALMRRNISFSDILDYVSEVDPNPLMVDVPRFPACPQKIRDQLTIAENGGTVGDQNESIQTEIEDGAQTPLVPLAVNGMVSSVPGIGLEKKSFLNETGAQPTKRARVPPEEALHSQHVMASFTLTDSGHVPIKKCLKATAAYAPPSPERPHFSAPAVPVYYTEPKKMVDNFVLEESVMQQHKFIQQTHFSKKMKSTSREHTMKQLKTKKNLAKLQKHSIPGRIKLPKPKKEEKMSVKKAKTLSKKALKSSQQMMHSMHAHDIPDIVEDIPSSVFDHELQKSRISSYEDSINAVIKNIIPEKIRFEIGDLKNSSPLPPILRSDSKDPEESFLLDTDVPLDSSQLSQLAAERDAHINDTIDGVIAQASLDDDLRMSPETGESDVEMEPRQLQSAVVDRFDVSSVPSPQIPPIWGQMLEEEVETEPLVKFEKDEFKMMLPEVSNTLTKQKSKKSKARLSEWPVASIDVERHVNLEERERKLRPPDWTLLDVNAISHIRTEDKQKKSKHRSSERLPFDFDPTASRDSDEWDRRTKQPVGQLLDLSRRSNKVLDEFDTKSKHRFMPSNHESLVSRTIDDLEKRPKHRSMDRQPFDLDPYVSRTTDESDRKSKHRTVDRQSVDPKLLAYNVGEEMERKLKHRFHDLDPFVYIGADESEIRSRHRTVESLTADAVAPYRKDVGDRDKKSKRRSQDRAAFIPNPDPLNDVERQSDSSMFLTNKVLPASAAEYLRVPLEVVNKLKRPASPAPLPLPIAALPALLSASLSTDVDFSGQPPLKRIKIVTSAGDINQFEIKPLKDEDRRHKKKDKKSKKSKIHDRNRSHKDRERIRDHKARVKGYDYKDRVKNFDRKKRDKLNKEDKSKKDIFLDGQDPLDFSLLSTRNLIDWNRRGKHRSDGQFHDRDASVGRTTDDSEKKSKHHYDRQPLEINAFASKTVEEMDRKSRSDREYKEDSDRQRSREPKRKDKSRDDRSESRKDEKLKERSEKSLERNEHKKEKLHKKEEKQNKDEILSTPSIAIPAVPRLTLKFSKMSSGTPSVVKSSEPEHVPDPEQLPEHGAARFSSPIKPIKLRFKGGLAGLATAVELAPPPFTFPTEKAETQPKPRSPFEVPTFSPSPESICIPSPHSSSGWCSDELEKPPNTRGRAAVRTPTPPSLSIPAPIISKPRLPSRSSLSPSPNRSLSPPTLFKSQDVDRQFSVPLKRSINTPSSASISTKSDAKNLPAQKIDTSSKVPNTKTPSSSKLTSTSKSARSSSKSVTHVRGIPPSTVMPPSQSLLPLISNKSVGGSSKAKKRVTTETVNTIVKPDGTTVWFCPDCREEADEWSIGCDKCDDWYHWSCVGIVVAPPEEEKWFCRRCVGQPQDLSKTPLSGRGRGKKTKK